MHTAHACLEQFPMKKKFLSQVFYIFMLYFEKMQF